MPQQLYERKSIQNLCETLDASIFHFRNFQKRISLLFLSYRFVWSHSLLITIGNAVVFGSTKSSAGNDGDILTERNIVLIIFDLDGTLYRPPVDPFFDYRVFMDISFDQVLKRAKERDVPKYGPEIIEKYMKKYIPAQKMYMEKFSPKQRANLVINNDDYNRPSIQNGRREEKKR